MSERQKVPDGLAEIAPGPALSAVLDSIDPERLSGRDCVEVLKARARQLAHEQARFMTAMVQVGLCRPAPDDVVSRHDDPPEWAADEIRAALVWSRRAAESRFCTAHDLSTRLPRVHRALDAGRIDEPRAKVFAEWTDELSPEQARRVCDALLPVAAGLTTGQLIDRIRRMAVAIDPEWAERRYHEAVRTRRVVGYRNPEGTANLSGLDLPVDRAAAACARIDALAKRVKRSGDRRPVDMIRADLFLGMLDGTYAEWDEQQIISHLLAMAGVPDHDRPEDRADRCRPPDDAGHEADTGRSHGQARDGGDPARSADGRGEEERPDHPRDAAGPDPDVSDQAADREAGNWGSAGAHGEPATRREAGVGPADQGAADAHDQGAAEGRDDGRADSSSGGDGADAAAGDGTDPGHRGALTGVELRVKLSTLLRLDEHPAEIAGWGHVHAAQARLIAARQTGAQWRYVVCDEHGALVVEGLIASRPGGYPARTKMRGAVVEIQISTSLLRRLTVDLEGHPEWARVVAQIGSDVARQLGGDLGARKIGGDLGFRRAASPDLADRRFPGDPLRRRVQTRDRTCVFRGCRMPARATDTDHNRRWEDDGRTQEHNLASLCRHDHRLKDEGGWRLQQPESGLLRWTSPLGQVYEVRPPPIIVPLPDPAPRPSRPATSWGAAGCTAGEGPIWWEPTVKPPPEHAGRPADRPAGRPRSGLDTEIPPF